jgi:YARHG domain-containing protein
VQCGNAGGKWLIERNIDRADRTHASGGPSPPGSGATQIPGLYPEFSTRVVSSVDIGGLSCFELRIAHNEIFARHGYKFKDKDLIDHFAMQPWYHPVAAEISPTPTELKNLEGLLAAATKKGC